MDLGLLKTNLSPPIIYQLFKAFAVETLYIGGAFSLSMKLGHYIKIPPRKTFAGESKAGSDSQIEIRSDRYILFLVLAVQIVVVFFTCFIQVAVKQWLFQTTPDICMSSNKNQLFCPRAKVFFTASVLWSVLSQPLPNTHPSRS